MQKHLRLTLHRRNVRHSLDLIQMMKVSECLLRGCICRNMKYHKWHFKRLKFSLWWHGCLSLHIVSFNYTTTRRWCTYSCFVGGAIEFTWVTCMGIDLWIVRTRSEHRVSQAVDILSIMSGFFLKSHVIKILEKEFWWGCFSFVCQNKNPAKLSPC